MVPLLHVAFAALVSAAAHVALSLLPVRAYDTSSLDSWAHSDVSVRLCGVTSTAMYLTGREGLGYTFAGTRQSS